MVEELVSPARGSLITVRWTTSCVCGGSIIVPSIVFTRAGAIVPALQVGQKRSNRNLLPYILTLSDQAREEQKRQGAAVLCDRGVLQDFLI